MKKILATVAGLVSFAMIGTACSAVDTEETTSTSPIAVSTERPVRVSDEIREFKTSRSAVRPAAKPAVPAKKPVAKTTPKATPKPKVVKPRLKKAYKPKVKVYKYKAKKKVVKKPKKVYYKAKAKKSTTKKTKAGKVRVSGIANCIGKYESGNNPKAQNKRSTASGYYQFINGTWNNYKGYRRAKDAPLSVQTEKFHQVWNGGKGAGNWVVAHKCGY